MSCVVHNVSDKCVKLARNSVIGYLTASLPKTAYALCVSDDKNDLENHKNALSKEIISTEEVVRIIDNLQIPLFPHLMSFVSSKEIVPWQSTHRY